MVLLALVALLLPALRAEPPSDAQLFLEKRVVEDPIDYIARNRLGELYLRCLRITGDLSYLARAASAAEASMKSIGPAHNAGGFALRAHVELASHRFAAARDTGKELQALHASKTGGLVVESDALMELGEYAGAEKLITEAVRLEEEVSVGSESRYARLAIIHGKLKEAGKHFENALAIALDQVTEPETIAWLQIQLGELAFKQGNWEQAEKCYLAAGEALPGWYVTDEHLAELRGAQGRYDEAQAAYEKLVARVERPELFQELGDLLVFAGKPDAAKPWHEKARALYERSIEQGEGLYLHHASGFYADSIKEPEKALATAQKDIEQRGSIYAWDTLAWAQYGMGLNKEAAASIEKALATGTRDPHILYHAGMIRMSAGDLKGGQAALRQTVEVNPRYQTFHVHR